EAAKQDRDTHIAGLETAAAISGKYSTMLNSGIAMQSAIQSHITQYAEIQARLEGTGNIRKDYLDIKQRALDMAAEYEKRNNAKVMAEATEAAAVEIKTKYAAVLELVRNAADVVDENLLIFDEANVKLRALSEGYNLTGALDMPAEVRVPYSRAQKFETVASANETKADEYKVKYVDAYSALVQKGRDLSEAEASLASAKASLEWAKEKARINTNASNWWNTEDPNVKHYTSLVAAAQTKKNEAVTARDQANTAKIAAWTEYSNFITNKLKPSYLALSGSVSVTTGDYTTLAGFSGDTLWNQANSGAPFGQGKGALADALASFEPDYERAKYNAAGYSRSTWEAWVANAQMASGMTFRDDQKKIRYEAWEEALDIKYRYEVNKGHYEVFYSSAKLDYDRRLEDVTNILTRMRREIADVEAEYWAVSEKAKIAKDNKDSVTLALNDPDLNNASSAEYIAQLQTQLVAATKVHDDLLKERSAIEKRLNELKTSYTSTASALFESARKYSFSSEFTGGAASGVAGVIDSDALFAGAADDIKGTLEWIFDPEWSAAGTDFDLTSYAGDLMKQFYVAQTISSRITELFTAKAAGLDVNAAVTQITADIAALENAVNTAASGFGSIKTNVDTWYTAAKDAWLAVENVQPLETNTPDENQTLMEDKAAKLATYLTQSATKTYTDEAKTRVDEIKTMMTSAGGVKSVLDSMKANLAGLSTGTMTSIQAYESLVKTRTLAESLDLEISHAEEIYSLGQKALYAAADALCGGVVYNSYGNYLMKEAAAKANHQPVILGDNMSAGDKKAWAEYYGVWSDYAMKQMEATFYDQRVALGEAEWARASKYAEVKMERITSLEEFKEELVVKIKIAQNQKETLTESYNKALADFQAAQAAWTAATAGTTAKEETYAVMKRHEAEKNRLKERMDQETKAVEIYTQEVQKLVGSGTTAGIIGGHTNVTTYERSMDRSSMEHLTAWTNLYKNAQQEWKMHYDPADNQYRLQDSTAPINTSYNGAWLEYWKAFREVINTKVDVYGYEIGPTAGIVNLETQEAKANVTGGYATVMFIERVKNQTEKRFRVTIKDNRILELTEVFANGSTQTPASLYGDMASVKIETIQGNVGGYTTSVNVISIKDWDSATDSYVTRQVTTYGYVSHTVNFSYDGARYNALALAAKARTIGEKATNIIAPSFQKQMGQVLDATQFEKAASEVAQRAYLMRDGLRNLRSGIHQSEERDSDYAYSSAEAQLRSKLTAQLLAARSLGAIREAMGWASSASATAAIFEKRAKIYTEGATSLLAQAAGLVNAQKSLEYNRAVIAIMEELGQKAKAAALKAKELDPASAYTPPATVLALTDAVRDEITMMAILRQKEKAYEEARDALREFDRSEWLTYENLSNVAKAKRELAEEHLGRMTEVKRQLMAYLGDAAIDVDNINLTDPISPLAADVVAASTAAGTGLASLPASIGGLYKRLLVEYALANEAASQAETKMNDKETELNAYLAIVDWNIVDQRLQAMKLRTEFEDTKVAFDAAQVQKDVLNQEKERTINEINALLEEAKVTRANYAKALLDAQTAEADAIAATREAAASTVATGTTYLADQSRTHFVDNEAVTKTEYLMAKTDWQNAVKNLVVQLDAGGSMTAPIGGAVDIYKEQILRDQIFGSGNVTAFIMELSARQSADFLNKYRVDATEGEDIDGDGRLDVNEEVLVTAGHIISGG
ncbi:MAG: hypothetical protein PHT95_03925, partial [Candidatus Omnitrophica bacterium]|nr:hypothetical protein [Candidatus Omnitrophota bacterium]